MLIAIMLVAAYLLGSIPTAVVAGRVLIGIDIRTKGSGNAGATNAARILGFKAGLVVAAVDLAKGLAAVLLVSRIAPLPGSAGPVLCGVAAVVGHVLPVFAGFRGGKGIATSAGAAIALFPVLAPFCFLSFLLAAALGRWVAVASLTAAFVLPVAYLVSHSLGAVFDPWRMAYCVAVFLIAIFTHRGNIARLFRGEEKKLDFKIHNAKLALILVNVVGGFAVLGSYIHGFLSHPGSASVLWGNVPALLLPFYTASMLAAAAGYLAFTFFVLVRTDPDEALIAGRFRYRAFLWLYAAILAPSALWMPLTFAMVAAPSLMRWAAVRIVLAIVGIASMGLVISLLGTKPAGRPWTRGLAIAGSVLFFIQTGVLDAIVWPAFFPFGS